MASYPSNLAKDIANSLWHAFAALDDRNTGYVQKSQLKVLTANIGTVIGVIDGEKGLQEYKSKNSLTFDELLHYLRIEILDPVLLTKEQKLKIEEQIDDVCWIICGKKYLRREFAVISDDNVFHMFRIFCMFAERKNSTENSTVVIDPEEVIYVWKKFVVALGKDWENRSLEELNQYPRITFDVFLKLMESKYVLLIPKTGISEAVKELNDEFMREIIKKGMLTKKGHVVPNWKDRWFILTPVCLTYYTNRECNEKKGEIILNKACSVKALPEKFNTKSNRFVISCYCKEYEISSIDQKTRQQWVIALENAITYSASAENFHRIMFSKRKEIRDAENFKKVEEEKIKKQEEDELERHKRELEVEKLARAEAETRALEEARMLEYERKRREELEAMQKEMEKLLDEERQAKHDEELVRSLQARLLADEWSKREEMEKLQESQQEMLLAERKRRQSLENEKELQVMLLEETKQHLQQLELERKKADEELKEAQEKLRAAELAKEKLKTAAKEIKVPIGLSRPILPKVGPIITHRGIGAFTPASFEKKPTTLTEEQLQNEAETGEGS